MIELEHSPLGGSAAHRFLTCSGSFLLQREQIRAGQYENIESDFAKLGIAAHELGARALLEDQEPFEYFGEEIDGYKVGWPDEISLDAVTAYTNECRSIMQAHNYEGWQVIEQTYKLPHIHPLLKGTIDFAFIADKIYLRDYKNGEGVGVSAFQNKQLLYYAVLLALGDKQVALMPNDTVVSLGITQPNFYGIFDASDIWETTLGYIRQWGNEVLLPAMNALMEEVAPAENDFTQGDHCQFCHVLLDCPKMQKSFMELAEASEDFIIMLTNAELDHFYAQREHAERFMTALDQTVKARLMTGADIKNAKLVEKRVNRSWKQGAEKALEATFGQAAFEPAKIKSPAQVEKLSTRGKELALEWGYKPQSDALTLAPINDPRPEAKPKSSADVFASYQQSPEEQGF